MKEVGVVFGVGLAVLLWTTHHARAHDCTAPLDFNPHAPALTGEMPTSSQRCGFRTASERMSGPEQKLRIAGERGSLPYYVLENGRQDPNAQVQALTRSGPQDGPIEIVTGQVSAAPFSSGSRR